MNNFNIQDFGLGWVEVYYEGDNGIFGLIEPTPEGIYHCPLVSWEDEYDEELVGNGWTINQKTAFGIGFNGDGTRPCDKSKILRHLSDNEIGVLDGYYPSYFGDRHCIKMIKN